MVNTLLSIVLLHHLLVLFLLLSLIISLLLMIFNRTPEDAMHRYYQSKMHCTAMMLIIEHLCVSDLCLGVTT